MSHQVALKHWVPIVAQELGQIVENKDPKNTTCVSGWWFGTFFIFHNIWVVILPIDCHIFQDG